MVLLYSGSNLLNDPIYVLKWMLFYYVDLYHAGLWAFYECNVLNNQIYVLEWMSV